MASPPPTSASEAQLALKIVFMGTPQLAAHILGRLLDASRHLFHVAAVVTRPDQPRGRGLRLEPSEVGRLSAAEGIPTLKPTRIRSPEFLAQLRSLAPDLLVIAAYGRILPNEVLEAARLMPINVHASLLPRFRGASPIEAAILAGEDETGITIMRVTERMDAGPILLQRKLPLAADETQGGLKVKLAQLGAATLLEALHLLRCGKLSETEQQEDLASYTSPVTKQHAAIDWNSDAVQIERMVRAYDPWPVARTRLGDDDLLIWRARVASQMPYNEGAPGTILSLNPQPAIKCGRGTLELLEVQAAGRRRMPAADFMRGRHIAAGACLGS
jgi:methionyl-tRNA formyltransferase